MTVKEACIVHGYDGWYIHIDERPLWSLVAERCYDWFWGTVLRDPCCNERLRWLHHVPGGSTVLWRLGTLSMLFWRRSDGWTYPVHDGWVAQYFPGSVSQLSEDVEPKDPTYGEHCPACGFGRVNDNPAGHIAQFGKCFRCIVAEKITWQDPLR